jgi:hypothetical protein
METRVDAFERTITQTLTDTHEVYTLPGGTTVSFPLGHGWDNAIFTINKMAPAGWRPPAVDGDA